jgi:general secretion pathway protein J
MTRRDSTAGVTLVEMLVALALLAAIGLAGFAALEQVLLAQGRTAGRLDRLAEWQRALFVVTLDLTTALPASLSPAPGGVGLARQGDEPLRVTYRLEEGTLWRSLAAPGAAAPVRQALVRDVAGAEWRYLGADGTWAADWPPEGMPAQLGAVPNPLAVELRLALRDGGALRRIAAMPTGLP